MLAAALNGTRPRRIIDSGTGTGRNLDWLREFGGDVVGLDRSPTGIAEARAAGRRVVQGVVDALPFRDGCADVVTSFDVIYSLPDEVEARAFAEMYRVLAPGGVMLVNAAALDILHGSHSTLTMEVRRYTRSRLASRLTRAGFRVERITYTNTTLFLPALAVRGLERLTGRAAEASENDLTTPPAPINGTLNAALAAEAAWLRMANLPIGTSVMAVARKPRSTT
jgi:SAM-dependent methyltransferase